MKGLIILIFFSMYSSFLFAADCSYESYPEILNSEIKKCSNGQLRNYTLQEFKALQSVAVKMGSNMAAYFTKY